jgi:hypothetical protein
MTPIFGRQRLQRERIEGHNKLTRSYFVDDPIYLDNFVGGVSE